jgi:hypothetical protein
VGLEIYCICITEIYRLVYLSGDHKATAEGRLAAFSGGYGTVLFFDDQAVIDDISVKVPVFVFLLRSSVTFTLTPTKQVCQTLPSLGQERGGHAAACCMDITHPGGSGGQFATQWSLQR